MATKTRQFTRLVRGVSTMALPHTKRRSSSLLRYGAAGLAAAGGLLLTNSFKHKVQAVSQRHRVDPSGFMAMPITEIDRLESEGDSMRSKMELLIMKTQADVCRALEAADGSNKFKVERWNTGGSEGGISCVLQDGGVLEKAGVNVSVMRGKLAASTADHFNKRGKNVKAGMPYFACGVSSVIHPRNPNCPTVHFNYRYFEVEREDGTTYAWFGGGTDITPFILDEQDVVHFHKTFQNACNKHDPSYYQKFKKWCDEYFVIKHRGETRGLGGIFFDDLDSPDKEATFQFVKTCTEAIVPSYLPIIEKNKNKQFSYDDRKWQQMRRGRYAEYNLVYDRGTIFGLLTPGTRIESILMSLPLSARWEYNHEPARGSKEARLLDACRNPRDWVSQA